jgi:phosphoglycolate phosphatase
MLKLLIFDLDGTLADTGQDIADALNYALEPFGQKKYSIDETKAMVGSGISNLLESLTASAVPPTDKTVDSKEFVTARFLEFYAEHLLAHTTAYPHVKETLAQLGSYKKAVLTNKREKYSKQILSELGLGEYFELVWGSDSVREKKPSPVPILDLVKKFNVTKEETAIIGDSNYDVDAGLAAGVKVIGVTYGFRSVEFLRGSDFIIDRFDELVNVLADISKSKSH